MTSAPASPAVGSQPVATSATGGGAELVLDLSIPEGMTARQIDEFAAKLAGELDAKHRAAGGGGLAVTGVHLFANTRKQPVPGSTEPALPESDADDRHGGLEWEDWDMVIPQPPRPTEVWTVRYVQAGPLNPRIVVEED